MMDVMVLGKSNRVTGIAFKHDTHRLMHWWDDNGPENEREIMRGTYEQCRVKQLEMDANQREEELF